MFFRFLNEQLYTTSGEEALELFRDDVTAFKIYHEGFTHQMALWEKKPVNLVIQYLQANR